LDVPFNELVDHACVDVDVTLQLYHLLKKELKKRRLSEQFSTESMALLRTLTDKECNGVQLNLKAVHRRREELTAEANALRTAVITEAGQEFDLDSPTETAAALRQIDPFIEQPGRRISRSQIEQLAGTHSVARLIVKYDRVRKLVRELEVICGSVRGNKVFPVFSQIRWAHGCLSSTGPRICDADGPLETTAVIDRTICDQMSDPDRSLTMLQRISGDEVLKKSLIHGFDHPLIIGKYAAGRDLDQKDLLLSVASGLSDATLCRRFLIDRLSASCIRRALEQKYATLFKWIDSYRRATIGQGFAYRDGRMKYLEGLRSSDIDKRHKALVSAVRWAIRY
jgi:DNA polymerase-1